MSKLRYIFMHTEMLAQTPWCCWALDCCRVFSGCRHSFTCSCLNCCLSPVGPEFPGVLSKAPNTKALWPRWLPVRFWVEVCLLVLTFTVLFWISDYQKGCFYPHVVVLRLRAVEMPKLESSCFCIKEAVDQCSWKIGLWNLFNPTDILEYV